jgi:predicted lipoprotein
MRRALAVATAALVLFGACSGDDGAGRGGDGTASTEVVLGALADGVIIPSYEAVVTDVQALGAALDALCQSPSQAALDLARDRWRDTDLAWQSTRATGVGPAIERRAMQAIAFRARADKVEAAVADPKVLDPATLDDLGADVRGIYAVEELLFAAPSASLASPDGTARCAYARSATQLAAGAAVAVLDQWTQLDGGYRGTFVAGMDGDPISSIGAVVNEMTFRLQQIDDQGIRALAEASAYDELPSARREGAAAHGLASTRGVLGGIAAAVLGPDGEPGLADLVRSRSADTADRLEQAVQRALEVLSALPDSSEAAFRDAAGVDAAAEAIGALHVLVATEVASQLGVTIGFSDSDGDS